MSPGKKVREQLIVSLEMAYFIGNVKDYRMLHKTIEYLNICEKLLVKIHFAVEKYNSVHNYLCTNIAAALQ